MKELDILARYKIWFETRDGKGILGDGKWKLLRAVSEAGSLKQAFENENLSYRKTWNNLKKIERSLGFKLIQTNRGGATGGSALLSEKAHRLMEAFDDFHKELDPVFQEALQRLNTRLNEVLQLPESETGG